MSATPPSTDAQQIDRGIADMAGSAALPRKNGELAFDAAWAGRAFGMTLALHQGCRFDWNEFRDRLIAEIGEADRRGADSTYYERWFAAFERLLAEKGLVSGAELDARVGEFESGRRDDVY